jgi:hypothetical protein
MGDHGTITSSAVNRRARQKTAAQCPQAALLSGIVPDLSRFTSRSMSAPQPESFCSRRSKPTLAG